MIHQWMMEWWLYVVIVAAVVVFVFLRTSSLGMRLGPSPKATKGVKKRIIVRDQDDEDPTDDPPTP